MIGEYSAKNTQTGSEMNIKNKENTFDDIIEDNKCEKYGYEDSIVK